MGRNSKLKSVRIIEGICRESRKIFKKFHKEKQRNIYRIIVENICSECEIRVDL